MAKIGTAHVEIKPVLNEEALEEITQRIVDTLSHALADLGPFVPRDEPLPLGWSIHLPDANGERRKFCLAERIAEGRDGEMFTTYVLVRDDHFKSSQRETQTNGGFGVTATTYRDSTEPE